MSVVCLAVFSVPCQTRSLKHQREHTQQALLKGLLVLDRLVCNLARVVILVPGRRVRVRVVLGEDAGAVVDGEDQDRLDAEEGKRARHGGARV